MHKMGRQKEILELLSQCERIEVAELSSKFDCSMMTIRRDLEELQAEGIVRKVHGGVIYLRGNSAQPSFYDRIKECKEEKALIGRAAAELIKNGDIVFLDGSTTCLAAAENIPHSLSFTAITNGLMTAVRLSSKSNTDVIVIGGAVDSPTLCSANFLAIRQIEMFQADLFLLSTNSISYPEGIYEKNLSLIELKKSFAARAKKTVLLADYRKFERKSLSLSLELKDIAVVITDKRAPAGILAELRGRGMEVIVV
jgi:DeoR family fructose operon transcriptional repressor